ncbi:magnesium/cobalt transporter CorA [Paenibacillus aurantius]|uniref:Magnesium transport protein CorA n=1 Tax=Paenibacillus aurantius TaxID=2918900 RepID=A0AA96REP4_9BACL|nr:magnesium/cobalt transporter CorA [Paenibacillus aurantius]WNQ10408.1 magnesium/cobalt transporter CorA [Paenibacillus aurantius]
MLVYHTSTGQVTNEKVRVPAEGEVAWIRLYQPDEKEIQYVLEELFHCHPLLVEDCIKFNQRPKLDRYKTNVFLTFYSFRRKELKPVEMAHVLGSNYVITIYKEELPFLEKLYREFEQVEDRMKHAGDILYHILDHCVDEYSELTTEIQEDAERLERAIYRNPNVRIAQDIFRQKRHLQKARRILVEEKTILSTISHQNLSFTRQETDVYFIDIYDHISRVIDTVDIYRESTSGLLELQMAMKSDRMNEIMKTLTIISSIFLPLTFIVGLYGMNFKHMPELEWKYGYAYVVVIMAAVAAAMWIFYKRKKWL